MSADDATLTHDQPSPTRNVPTVMTRYSEEVGTRIEPIAMMTSPSSITLRRPIRSESRPNGIEKPNMPTTCSDTETEISESP